MATMILAELSLTNVHFLYALKTLNIVESKKKSPGDG